MRGTPVLLPGNDVLLLTKKKKKKEKCLGRLITTYTREKCSLCSHLVLIFLWFQTVRFQTGSFWPCTRTVATHDPYLHRTLQWSDTNPRSQCLPTVSKCVWGKSMISQTVSLTPKRGVGTPRGPWSIAGSFDCFPKWWNLQADFFRVIIFITYNY